MTTRPYLTTNAALAAVEASLEELIGWADADAEHALENDAPATARDDFRRATNLRRALELVRESKR